MPSDTWRERFRLARLERGYIQEEIAAILDADGTKISDIETGKQSPAYEDMLKIAHELHISLDALGAPGPFDHRACMLPTWPGKSPKLLEKVEERKRRKAERMRRRGYTGQAGASAA